MKAALTAVAVALALSFVAIHPDRARQSGAVTVESYPEENGAFAHTGTLLTVGVDLPE